MKWLKDNKQKDYELQRKEWREYCRTLEMNIPETGGRDLKASNIKYNFTDINPSLMTTDNENDPE